MPEKHRRNSAPANERPRLTHANFEAEPFRWTPAPGGWVRVWLLAVLLGTIALAHFGDAPHAGLPEPAPALRHYDPLMTW